MSNLETKIHSWRVAMLSAFPRQREIVDELEDHLRESVAGFIKDGVPLAQAFAQAIDEIGSPRNLAAQFQEMDPKMNKLGRALRIVLSVVVGTYLAMMAIYFVAIGFHHLRKGISPFSAQGEAAFFTSFIVCVVCSAILWLMWRKTPRQHYKENQSGTSVS